jgi:hypothetical protein
MSLDVPTDDMERACRLSTTDLPANTPLLLAIRTASKILPLIGFDPNLDVGLLSAARFIATNDRKLSDSC